MGVMGVMVMFLLTQKVKDSKSTHLPVFAFTRVESDIPRKISVP